MKLKKLLATGLALCMAGSMLAGCGSGSGTTTAAATTAAPAGTTAEATTAADGTTAAGTTAAASAGETDFPTKNVSGIIQWGAGGGTDNLMRPLATLAEKELGKSIVVENKAGATGTIATQYVYDKDADGYTLLMGAENPQLYTALDLLNLTYADFEPVFLIVDETVGIVVSKDSPYKSFTELINAALEKPGELTISTTGKGGLPWEVGSFITAVTGATFNQVPYDSDAAAKTAVIGGECDFTVCKIQSGIEDYKAGTLNFLCMFSKEPAPAMPEVPLITAEYPDFEQYMPWGPFYGVFVKKGTDQAIIDKLGEAFKKAYEDPAYQEQLANTNVNALGLTGSEAKEYMKNWQLNTINALNKSGAIDKTAADLGLE